MSYPETQTLETFVAVVESGGFSRAAKRLETTTGAVSRRIAALEQRLGLVLINRTTRKLSLTEAGEQYYQDISAALQALGDAEDRVSHLGDAPAGELRVAVPLSFAVRALGPRLAGFHARYPQLRLCLDLDDRVIDIVASGVDLALRIGPLQDSSLVARRIADLERVFCAAPEYLARRGRPTTPSDLKRHQCLRYNNLAVREEWTLASDAGSEAIEVNGPLCANNGDLLRGAALAGMGICSLPAFIVAEDLSAGRLERVLEDYSAPRLTLSAVWPSRRFVPAKVRAFVDWLVEALAAERRPN